MVVKATQDPEWNLSTRAMQGRPSSTFPGLRTNYITTHPYIPTSPLAIDQTDHQRINPDQFFLFPVCVCVWGGVSVPSVSLVVIICRLSISPIAPDMSSKGGTSQGERERESDSERILNADTNG